MNRLLIFIYLFCIGYLAHAQRPTELVTAYTDKDCYLTGERLCVRVDATIDGGPSPSRVAYVEIADTRRMYAQCMVALREGKGWAEIALPATMHSGCYQLAAYTRISQGIESDGVHRSIIGIINGEKLSRQDNIIFLPPDSSRSTSLDLMARYKAGETVSIPLPEVNVGGYSVSVAKSGLNTDLSDLKTSFQPAAQDGTTSLMLPEVEGHIVRARTAPGASSDVWITRLALVGKMASLFDGKRQKDGSYLFYTSDINGTLPVLATAYDSLGQSVPMELISPYLSLLPKTLPKLTVYTQEETLRERASAAHRQAIVNELLTVDSLNHSFGFMSIFPDYYYDLDEYTQMNDVNELLLEFVKGIKKQRSHGVSMLYTFNNDTKRYSKWAALILLDGIPVYDVDEILKYDAHLIKYVQIYSGIFNFGSSCCQGVISFITRNGRLSNYQLKDGSHLVSYTFPQDRPTYFNHTGSEYNTLLWLPVVKGTSVKFTAPHSTGQYQLTIQGKDSSGNEVRQVTTFEVY